MPSPLEFVVHSPGYIARQLSRADAGALQKLYEACHDYALIEQGAPYSPTAATDEFDTFPPGKTEDDKFLFGLFNGQNEMVALIESIRHYPDEITWWLGLMLVTPPHRRNHLGTRFYHAYEQWVSEQGAHSVQLAVLEENDRGAQFWHSLGFREIRRPPTRLIGNKHRVLIVLQRRIIASESEILPEAE